jgi:hypothetical protein
VPAPRRRDPLSVRLPEAEEARLRAYAAEKHISLGHAVRLALRELLGDAEPPAIAPPGNMG